METLHKIGETLAALSTQEQIALALAGGALLLLLMMVVLLRKPHDETERRGAATRRQTTSDAVDPVAAVKPAQQPVAEQGKSVASTPVNIVKNVLVDKGPLPAEPQDSVLRRHYLAEQVALRLRKSQPYPTDSVLVRHQRQLAQSKL